MPDGVATNIYQPLQAPQQQQMTPLGMLQLIGQMQQNENFKREMDSRQAVGQIYHNSRNPDGSINFDKLRKAAPDVGYYAPEAVQGATENASSAAELGLKYQKMIQSRVGALSHKPTITNPDVSEAKTDLAASAVPGAVIQDHFSRIPRINSNKDQERVREIAITNQNLARGPEATASGTEGPVDEGGVRPQITQGRAAYERNATNPDTGQVGMRTELPVGEKGLMEEGAKAKASSLVRAGSYAADIYPMQELLKNIHELGPQGVGPGTKEFNTFKSFVQSNLHWLPGSEKLSGDPEKIANYEEGEKYATQLAAGRAGMFGHGTDQAMATSLIGSPNMHLSQLSGENLTKALIGLKRMEQLQAAEGANVPVHKYLNWARDWSTTIDPRAMMIDTMDKKQRDNLQKSLNTPQKLQRFNDSVDRVVAAGLMELPQVQK